MSQFTEGDSAVNRLNAAVSAFEKVLTEPEGTVVEMPIGAAQPSLAERLKRALDAVTVKPAQAASQATAAAQQAQVAQQAAAQSAADAANSAAATGYVDAPFPDVWAPLNDDLRLLAGFAPADTITVAGTSYPLPSKSITFARATTATYIDKSGVLRTAAVNEPRFEKEGLLVEGASTNFLLNTTDPSLWGSSASFSKSVIQADGRTQAVTGRFETITTNLATATIHSNARFDMVAGDYLSVSCRIKGDYGFARLALAKDGTSTLTAYFNVVTGVLSSASPGVNTFSIDAGNGYWYIGATFPISESAQYSGFITAYKENADTYIPLGKVFYCQTPQVEKNSCTTSYIPTGASAVTRAADDCTLQRSGNDNWWGPITISVDMHCNGPSVSDGTANSRRGILSFYPSITEYAMMMLDSSTSNLGKYLFAYGPATFNVFNQKVDDGAIYRLAATSDSGQIRAFVNGATTGNSTAVVRPTPGTISSVNTLIYLGRGAGANASGVRMLNGHIRNLRIWHRVLSDTQIKGLR